MDINESIADKQAKIQDQKTYNLDIYLKVYYWFVGTMIKSEYIDYDIVIYIDKNIYANIFYDSDNDIQICMYSDDECSENIDGGGICCMTDLQEYMEELSENINGAEQVRLNKYIEDKVEFIYELLFTG